MRAILYSANRLSHQVSASYITATQMLCDSCVELHQSSAAPAWQHAPD